MLWYVFHGGPNWLLHLRFHREQLCWFLRKTDRCHAAGGQARRTALEMTFSLSFVCRLSLIIEGNVYQVGEQRESG